MNEVSAFQGMWVADRGTVGPVFPRLPAALRCRPQFAMQGSGVSGARSSPQSLRDQRTGGLHSRKAVNARFPVGNGQLAVENRPASADRSTMRAAGFRGHHGNPSNEDDPDST